MSVLAIIRISIRFTCIHIFALSFSEPPPPTSLSCSEIVSTSIDLGWQPPALPNGDIQYYLIDTFGFSAPAQINTSTSVVTYHVKPLLAGIY